jgi:predicted permease
MNTIFRRIIYLLNRRRFEQELFDDMEFHREMAAQAGNRNFGNTLRLREEARDAWGWTWVDRFGQDLRYSIRMLRQSPGFTAMAVLILALGIGVNVAGFGFFNLMILRPLPIRHPETLLRFQRQSPGNFSDNFSNATVAFYREHSTMLSAVLELNFANLTIEGEAKPLHANFVTANFLSELGAVAAPGRILDPVRDDTPDAEPVVVLSHGYWERQFAADPSVIGRMIRLNGKPVTVVGVASPEFSGLGLESPDVWAPIARQPYFFNYNQALTDFSERGLNVQMWGRLRPGATPRAAEEELASLTSELRRQHPEDIWKDERLPSRPGGYAVGIRHEMYPVFGLVATLGLLILTAACGSLGGLLLARGVAREREIHIRAALGAGRGRLIRQLLTEALVLASVGMFAGVLLGYLVLRGLILWTGLPAWLDPSPDWRVIAFAVSLGLGTAVLFGLMPSLQIARQRHRASILRQFLIGGQVAASCGLLIVAGLLVRALNHAAHTNPGFEYQKVISVDPALVGYTPAGARAYFDTLESRLARLSGVESVALVSNPPLGNRWTVMAAEIAGRSIGIHINHVNPAFFDTMRIPFLRGRNLLRGNKGEIAISESLARLQWPGENPVGKQFRLGTEACTVVGVTGSARLVSPEDSDAVEVYRLPDPDLLPSMVALIRTSGPPEGLVHTIESAARVIDPKLFPEVRLMKEAYRGKLQDAEYMAVGVIVLGCVALFLACAGILGLVAYAVAQGTREIGIRMALGARPSDIMAVVFARFLVPILTGSLVGIGGAGALSQILRRVLYGISNIDPVSYVAAVGVLGGAAALAMLLPARQALRIDPLHSIRHE